MKLVQEVGENKIKHFLIYGTQITFQQLEIVLIAKGIKNREDYLYSRDKNIHYIQGGYFCKLSLKS